MEFRVLWAVAAELPCPHSHFYVRFSNRAGHGTVTGMERKAGISGTQAVEMTAVHSITDFPACRR